MEILNGDALQLMEASGNAYDLIILDPDYQDWGYMIENGLIEKALELLNPDGNILLFTKQPFDYNLRIKINPWFRREIVWTFENGGAWVSKKMPLVSTQKIYWMVKSNDFYFYVIIYFIYSIIKIIKINIKPFNIKLIIKKSILALSKMPRVFFYFMNNFI